MDRQTRSPLTRQSSALLASGAHARDDTPVSTPPYAGRGHAQHQAASGASPPRYPRLQHQNIPPYYLHMPTGYGYPGSAGPLQVYWGPPSTYQPPSWGGHQMQQRPQFGPPGQIAPGGVPRHHVMPMLQPPFISPHSGRPQWFQQTAHQPQQSPQQQYQPQPHAQYSYVPPPMEQQQQQYTPFQGSLRARSLIPGNGERSCSSSLSNIRSTRCRSIGSARSTSAEDRPEASPSSQPQSQQPESQLVEPEPASQEASAPLVPSSHVLQATASPKATPIQPPCAHFLKSGRCGFGDRCKFAHGVPMVEYNSLGLPLREGQQECQFYRKHLRCGFGASCKYHHPEPPAGNNPSSSTQWQPTGAMAMPLGGDSQALEGYLPPQHNMGLQPPLQPGPVRPPYGSQMGNLVHVYAQPHLPLNVAHPPASTQLPYSLSGGGIPYNDSLNPDAASHLPLRYSGSGHVDEDVHQGPPRRRSRLGNVRSVARAHEAGRTARQAGRGREQASFAAATTTRPHGPSGSLPSEGTEAIAVLKHNSRRTSGGVGSDHYVSPAAINDISGAAVVPLPAAVAGSGDGVRRSMVPPPQLPPPMATTTWPLTAAAASLAAASAAMTPLPLASLSAATVENISLPLASLAAATVDKVPLPLASLAAPLAAATTISAAHAAAEGIGAGAAAGRQEMTPVAPPPLPQLPVGLTSQQGSRDATCHITVTALIPAAAAEGAEPHKAAESDQGGSGARGQLEGAASSESERGEGAGAAAEQLATLHIETSEDEGSFKSC